MRIPIAVFLCALLIPCAYAETIITINGNTIRTSGSNITVIVDDKVLTSNVLQGSGKITTETPELSEFDTLRLDISSDVTVIKGEKAKCVITADDNILPLILTSYADKALRISAKESYFSRQKVEITIEIPQLKRVEINGAGGISATGVLKDRADLVINGSGEITATGQVKELFATINGSGDLHVAQLEAETATVIINGSGDADVRATDSLMAKVNGSGAITYIGTPSEVHTSVQGSGNISNN